MTSRTIEAAATLRSAINEVHDFEFDPNNLDAHFRNLLAIERHLLEARTLLTIILADKESNREDQVSFSFGYLTLKRVSTIYRECANLHFHSFP